jgi:hypothetical protein
VNCLLQLARAQARRWVRAQRRLPANQFYVRRRTETVDGRLHTTITRRVVGDAMVFQPFWRFAPGAALEPTELLLQFTVDYQRARRPAATPGEALPLALDAEAIARLLEELESWHRGHWLQW